MRDAIAGKGRAIAARPLLLLAFTVLFVVVVAPTAQALPTPFLIATNPASPGASLTPRIMGTAEEGGTKVVTFGLGSDGLGPITRDVEPDDTVRIYTTSDCTGTVTGEGTVAALKGEGIQVAAVAPDSVTVFYATVDSESEPPSECSDGLAYRQVSTPPGAPTFSSVNPPSPANDNFPRLIGSADPEATVSIYATPDCGGSPVAGGSGALFGSTGIQVSVADNSETTFSAEATIAGFSSTCSPAPIAYAEVTPPPAHDPGTGGGGEGGTGGGGGVAPGSPVTPPAPPRLRTIPGGSANNNTPLVAGSAPAGTAVRIYATPDCSGAVVARGSAVELAAGIPVRVIDNTAVVFAAVAVAGETVSRCSDPVLYVEDSLTPRTRITMAPAAKTAKRKAVIRFTDSTGSSPGTTFRCKIDKKKWRSCSSPLRLKKLKPRRYTVRVKASDPAGNVEGRGAKRSFKVIRRS
jgi:hypothetical protein